MFMWVEPVCTNTMRQYSPVTVTANRAREDRGNWTAGGLLVTMLVVPALLALMAAPEVALGAVVGAVGVKLARRATEREDTTCVVDRSTESSGTQRANWTSVAD